MDRGDESTPAHTGKHTLFNESEMNDSHPLELEDAIENTNGSENFTTIKLSFQSDPLEECSLTDPAAVRQNSEDDAFNLNTQTSANSIRNHCLTKGFRVQCILRCTLLISCIMSIGCMSFAGTTEIDILELPLSQLIRLHIFSSVFMFLTSSALLIVLSTSLIDLLPLNWPVIDASTHSLMGLLYMISSSLLLHLENIYRKQYLWVTDWTRSLLIMAAAFGFFATAICIILTVQHFCMHSDMRLLNGRSEPTEDIMMKAMISR